MAKKGNKPSVQTVGLVKGKQNDPMKALSNQMRQLVVSQPTMGKGKTAQKPMTVQGRESSWAKLMSDPTDLSINALPPVSLPSRACAFGIYQEVLLSTDTNGNAVIFVQPTMNTLYNIGTLTSAGVFGSGTNYNASEYTSFSTNYASYIPTVMEVRMTWCGAALNTSGRFYGIVGTNTVIGANVSTFPQESFGCEALATDGISCVWYSTDAVWDCPMPTNTATTPSQWMSCNIMGAIMGAPPSVTNAITVGIYIHFAAFPNIGICGLTPAASLLDPSASMVSNLLQNSQSGIAKSATTLSERQKHRKKIKGVIKDVLTMGGAALGTVFPALGPGVEAAHILAKLLG